jgi:hypothetical protein
MIFRREGERVNVGLVILLVISGWALLSIVVAATIGKAAGRRDIETASPPSDARNRRIAS